MAFGKAEAQTEVIEINDVEKHQTIVKTDERIPWWTSCKQSPRAVASCLYFLFTCIMWGYDGLAGAIVLSIPRWRQDYGYLYEGQWVVSANWQLAFTSASLIGLMGGGLATGLIAKRFGQKLCVAGAYALTVGGVFCQWFSPGNMPLFFAGKLLTGIPLGIFLTIAPTYCSDVAPPALRGALVAAVNFSIAFGQLLGYAVMRETQSKPGPESYLIMYAVQWGFAGVGLLLLPLVPESPFRLLGRGKIEAAQASIRKLYGSEYVDTKLNEIRAILQRDSEAAQEAGSFRDCFNRHNRLRTLIVLSVFFFQANSGVTWVVGYMGYFMQLSGMQGMEVFDATVGIAGVMVIGNMASWFLIERLGRRKLIFSGEFADTCWNISNMILRSGMLHSFAACHWRLGLIHRKGKSCRTYSSCLHGFLGIFVPSFHRLCWVSRLHVKVAAAF